MDLKEALKTFPIEQYELAIKPLVSNSESDLLLVWNAVTTESQKFCEHLYKMENPDFFKKITPEESEKFYKKHQVLKKIIYEKLLEKYYKLCRSYNFDETYIKSAKTIANKANSLKKNGLSVSVDFVNFRFYINHFEIKTVFETPLVSVPTIISELGVDKSIDPSLFSLFVVMRMSEEDLSVLRELYTFSKYLKI